VILQLHNLIVNTKLRIF